MTRLRRPAGRIGRFAGCRRGATAVEFALVGAALAALLIGTLEIGRTLYARSELAAAASIVARMIQIDPAATEEALAAAARAAMVEQEGRALEVAVVAETVGGVPCRTVTLRHALSPLVLPFDPGGLTLVATRRVPIT